MFASSDIQFQIVQRDRIAARHRYMSQFTKWFARRLQPDTLLSVSHDLLTVSQATRWRVFLNAAKHPGNGGKGRFTGLLPHFRCAQKDSLFCAFLFQEDFTACRNAYGTTSSLISRKMLCRSFLFYSPRNDCMGSILAARCAGNAEAASASNITAIAAPISTSGSKGFT